MTRARLGAAAAAGLVVALLAAAPVGAQPGSSSIERRSVTLTVPLPEAGAVTVTRFAVGLTRPGTSRSVAGALTVSSDYGRLPSGVTVLARLRTTGPGRTAIDVVVTRRKPGTIAPARGASLAADEPVQVALVVEAQRRFALRVTEVSRWRSSPLFDRPAPVCRSGTPAIRPAFLFLAGRSDPVAEPALPEGETWAELLPGLLCRASPGSIGVLNPAGCAFALEPVDTAENASLAGWCGSTLRELRISSSTPFTSIGQVSITGPGGSPNAGACRLEGGAIVCPVALVGPAGLSARLPSPGVPVDVEIVPADSPRALYRLG